MILVRAQAVIEELPIVEDKGSEVEPPLCSCSVLVSLLDYNVRCIKITGVYFPPKSAESMEQVSRLTASAALRR